MTRTVDSLALLSDIQARSRAHALGLPQQIEVRRTWSGIGFRVGDKHLVAALGEVREILRYPVLTRVPGTKPWVKGIANVRGNLLPVMDLLGFLRGDAVSLGRSTRVLVIRHGGLAAGLVVDEVMGLKHFFDEERTGDTGEQAELSAYLREGYRQAGVLWGVFSMPSLAADPQFMQVAASG